MGEEFLSIVICFVEAAWLDDVSRKDEEKNGTKVA